MTLAEFKAWFDGYVENIDDMPTAKQWKRVKDRIGEIHLAVPDYPGPVYPRWIENQRELIWPVVTCTSVSTGSVGSPEYVAEEDLN